MQHEHAAGADVDADNRAELEGLLREEPLSLHEARHVMAALDTVLSAIVARNAQHADDMGRADAQLTACQAIFEGA